MSLSPVLTLLSCLEVMSLSQVLHSSALKLCHSLQYSSTILPLKSCHSLQYSLYSLLLKLCHSPASLHSRLEVMSLSLHYLVIHVILHCSSTLLKSCHSFHYPALKSCHSLQYAFTTAFKSCHCFQCSFTSFNHFPLSLSCFNVQSFIITTFASCQCSDYLIKYHYNYLLCMLVIYLPIIILYVRIGSLGGSNSQSDNGNVLMCQVPTTTTTEYNIFVATMTMRFFFCIIYTCVTMRLPNARTSYLCFSPWQLQSLAMRLGRQHCLSGSTTKTSQQTKLSGTIPKIT